MSSDIVFSSATELAADIRFRRLSATDVLEAHLAQIERCNPALNAVVTLDIERARAKARLADEATARRESWGPLHGVPFTLKDCHATAGMRTTCGFPPLADYVPEHDGTVSARLQTAGGILVGKTNVAMLLADYQTNNPLFGRTNNPWDVARTPGGSSGGAAAAVAAGMTPFDVGTDLSGSLRAPAHFCGLFALKPTERRVSLEGIVVGPPDAPRPIRVMSSIGPLARTVDDLALIYQIIAGQDGRDTDVAPVPVEATQRVNLSQLRVAIAPAIPGYPVAAEVASTVETFGAMLGALCRVVDAASLPALDYDPQKLFEPAQLSLESVQPNNPKPPTLAQYVESLHRRDQHIIAWESFFDEWDILVIPPAMVTAFPHCEPGAPLQVDGRKESYWMAHAYSTLFNYTGHPAIVLPVTRDRDGLPIGVQVVAKRWTESRLLGIATALAEVTEEFARPPGY